MKFQLSDKTWFGSGVAIFLGIVGIVGYLLWHDVGEANRLAQNEAFVAPKASITPKIAPEQSLEELKFAIWNGSGVGGAAGKMAQKLTTDGHIVVEAKNAPKRSQSTLVKISRNVASQQNEISKLLGIEQVEVGLSSELSYNVLIVLGEQ